MDFLHPVLLAGAALAVAPIILHLIMKQKPRRIEFPAIRFVERRQDANRRQMKLRHLLLLALRVAAICLLAMALARPSIKSSGVIGNQQAPVAAVMVFDTLPRMEYRLDNKTRIEVARETALWLLAQLPLESEVAVLDSSLGVPVFQVDLGAAKQRLERLEITPVGQALVRSVAEAAELLKKSELERKELYVFTDLARAAWETSDRDKLAAALEPLDGLGVYVIDVGVEDPQNLSLGELRLSSEVAARNSPLSITTDLSSLGIDGTRPVELSLTGPKAQTEKLGQETAQLTPGTPQPVEFVLAALDEGIHQGAVRVIGADNLSVDDVRYFTVEVRPAWSVLVVASEPAAEQAFYLTEALAPEAFRINHQARFDCRVTSYDHMLDEPLERFSAVCLLDPPPTADGVWQQLGAYATLGGGVVVFLGPAAQPAAMNTKAAQEVLSVPLDSIAERPAGDVHLVTDAAEHAMLSRFRPLRGVIPWDLFPVFRYWRLGPPAAGAATVAEWTTGEAAIVERPLGKGRVVTVTTSVAEPRDASTADRWNELATGIDAWPFVMLANEMFLYLVGNTAGELNYTAGEVAVLSLDAAERFPTLLVSTPHGEPFRQSIDSTRSAVTITATNYPGQYRARAGGSAGGIDLGFSVNLPVEASRLERIEPTLLDETFGKVDFQLARSQDDIDRKLSKGRVGVELFPYLVLAMAIILAMEHVMANRFYRN